MKINSNNKDLYILVKNIKKIMLDRGFKGPTLAKKANIPYSTLAGILSFQHNNPKVFNIQSIAIALNVNLSQLIGEIPINNFSNYVPIISWDHIDTYNKFISYHSECFINTNFNSFGKLFALNINENTLYNFYKSNLIILEENPNFIDNDIILLYSKITGLIVTEIKIKNNDIIILNTKEKPLTCNKNEIHVFGVVKEARLYEM